MRHAGLPEGHKNSFAARTMGIRRRVVGPRALHQIQRRVLQVKKKSVLTGDLQALWLGFHMDRFDRGRYLEESVKGAYRIYKFRTYLKRIDEALFRDGVKAFRTPTVVSQPYMMTIFQFNSRPPLIKLGGTYYLDQVRVLQPTATL